LIVLVAIVSQNAVGDALRQSLPSAASVGEAVDAEGEGEESHDMPRDAIRKAIFAAVARIKPPEQVAPGAFIAELLRLADSRASRIVRRLGANPATVVDRLDKIHTS
jgi:hypothetical protein